VTADPDPRLLLVDGDNLLHRVRGTRDEAGERWLLAALRGSLSTGMEAIVVLDGTPGPGQPPVRRIARGLVFRHSGRLDADTVLLDLLAARPYRDRAETAVITDDRSLADRARARGGLARRLDWLVERMDRAARMGDAELAAGRRRGAPGLGAGPRPKADAAGPATDDDEALQPWKPGRGATRKRGNPARGRRSTG
jgi:hypothetical protein